jgi:hypothetical protein
LPHISQHIIDDLAQRLWAKSEFVGDCLLWDGPKSGKGYGVIGWLGRQIYIHRLVYSLHHPDEELKIIRHSCDTPNCWHINHLFNGTTQDNVDDKVAKQRHIFGSDNYNTVLSETDISIIRSDTRKLREIAAEYGVVPATICYIKARKTWKHVP